VTNAEFTKALGRTLRRPAWQRIPKFGPKLLLGSELAEALLFTGQRVMPVELQKSGFKFSHSTIDVALRALLNK
jgi:NAD dependent epimerase/dehydratase family enzyme